MKAIPYSRLWLLCAILLTILVYSTPASAHEGEEALRSFEVQAGPYPVTVHYYSEGRGGQPLQFAIEADASVATTLSFRAQAIPGATVEAVPVRATLEADPAHPGAMVGTVFLPVSGQWLLEIDVEGPQGGGGTSVPILATPPPAIPEWLGWAVGLLPVAATCLLLLWQALRAGQIPQERVVLQS